MCCDAEMAIDRSARFGKVGANLMFLLPPYCQQRSRNLLQFVAALAPGPVLQLPDAQRCFYLS